MTGRDAELRAEAAAEALEKLAAWAWAQDGFLTGTGLAITRHAQTTAAFLRKFAGPGNEADR